MPTRYPTPRSAREKPVPMRNTAPPMLAAPEALSARSFRPLVAKLTVAAAAAPTPSIAKPPGASPPSAPAVSGWPARSTSAAATPSG